MQNENWKCVTCNELVEFRFKKCWNCGSHIDGTPDPFFERADCIEVTAPDARWQERVRGLWILAMLIGLLSAFLAGRQRSSVFAVMAIICFGYIAIQFTAWWLVRTAGRMRM
jgi:hypothetical protein